MILSLLEKRRLAFRLTFNPAILIYLGDSWVIAHQYFQVSLKIVWNTIRNNLPPLVIQLEDLLIQEFNQNENNTTKNHDLTSENG